MNIFCIIVTFNGSKWIRRSLDSLAEKEQGLPVKVVVVDNGSTDDTLSIIRGEYPETVVIESGKNEGFGRANNRGIEYAYNHGASHFLLLNQDASMAPGSVRKLVEVQTEAGLPLVSPIHWDGTGKDLDNGFCMYVSESPGNKELLGDFFRWRVVKDYYSVRYVNAACWLLTKETIEKVGGFDPIFYHYGEDDDYCARLIFHGGSPYIVPGASMFHDRVGKGNLTMWNKNKVMASLLRMYGVKPIEPMARVKTHFRLFKKIIRLILTLKFKDASTILHSYHEFLKRVPLLKSHAEVNKRPGPSWLSLDRVGIYMSELAGQASAKGSMMDGLLRCLARFSEYMVSDYVPSAKPNRRSEQCGFFKSLRNKPSWEDGVRTNADMSMLCAFLVKYAKPLGVSLPEGVSYDMLEEMARCSLVHAYSTHKAVKLKSCADGKYWGSVSSKNIVWESPLWAFSVAWSAFFQWSGLSAEQKESVYKLLKAECDSALQVNVPTGYFKRTRAEENGWSVCLLAATLGLFPDDPLAPRWFERMRVFAVNSYSHNSDETDTAAIDPWYDEASVADLYLGANLYDDYSLRKHHFFHTSYQNVVIQELGEAAVTLRLFQRCLRKEEKWKSNSLLHNIKPVMENVLSYLALPDGELAMPNGNDWSLFLFDQITSYSAMATLMKNPDAAMLESLAFKNISERQSTTPDGSWLLRSDIGPRRMGVQGHRVMMSYLMHLTDGDPELVPTSWEDFRQAHSEAYLLPCQDVVRSFTKSRFAIFSYSEGLSDYTGYLVPNSPDKAKIMVPFREGGGGNFTGWFGVDGKESGAELEGKPFFSLKGDSFVTGGVMNVCDNSLEHSFALYATPFDAVVYIDSVTAKEDVTITAERGLVAAISVDEFTSVIRVLSYDGSPGMEVDGESLIKLPGNSWVNIDGEIGVLARGGEIMAFGEKTDNHSILTAKFFGSYSDIARTVLSGETVCSRAAVYYTGVTPENTAELNKKMIELDGKALPLGWSGCVAADRDGSLVMLVANFKGESSAGTIAFDIDPSLYPGAPVFSFPVKVACGNSAELIHCECDIQLGRGEVSGESTKVFLFGDGVEARLSQESSETIRLRSLGGSKKVVVGYISDEGIIIRKEVNVGADGKEAIVNLP